MNRETTNRIRFVLEDVLPPIVRDSALFRGVASMAWGGHITRLAAFRERAPFLTADEYETLYREHPRVHEGTDNSEACIERIIADTVGDSVCDVGCGTGVLIKRIREARDGAGHYTGVDFVVADAAAIPGVDYVAARIEYLPFPDAAFDTVICTHVIEHVLEYRQAIAELRRICRTRLIIVVPREREYRYSFNPHFNFFPYTHSFLRAVHPVPRNHACVDIGRDIYYSEDRLEA
ncbi:class I SAM-dependent methyltransferase [Mesorhizobium muleiense]|uniref:Methyltransferase domain-containing protein n=1 Tax=Mesorhizobium muleiense TaxID=1004279 RepID=A0A1G9HP71_9HYPH|nr:class I SAM-dependent methyltransferase [Mesorhizobium muleiense]MCF6102123.1 class I SAM-dependent methyltransferase [Mesorhizobium muleiense]SDL14739.1 Methyltransferase domain-containing protein [Mesorhizobium muleiense]